MREYNTNKIRDTAHLFTRMRNIYVFEHAYVDKTCIITCPVSLTY